MKYFKWIMLVIFVISLVITIVLFFDHVEKNNGNNNNNNNNNVSDKENNFKTIYTKKWYRNGISYYEYGELANENFELNDLRFMIFNEEYVEYCDMNGETCNKYNYEYDAENNTIYIDSEDKFVTKGTYNITFDEEKMELSQNIDKDIKVVYHFS